jgi:hypothetical protein
MIGLKLKHALKHCAGPLTIAGEPVEEGELVQHLGVIWRDIQRAFGMPPRAFCPRRRVERRVEQRVIGCELGEQSVRGRKIRIDFERVALQPVAVFDRRADRAAFAAGNPRDHERGLPGLEGRRGPARQLLLG